ncbi:MAG: pyruvate ferredoxin oxidoreductase [Candidatus Aenigmarchaeota archaeon]|nr:pyruvate ferredoxin oxidoreductase [Candidatus Aenigmarchaeota archaeon]
MVVRKVLEGSHAIAEAVKLCNPDVVAAYPITPQTHIIERISEMVADGEFKTEFSRAESEHSAMSICLGAQAAGVRTFTSSASQGIALMHEVLYNVSGMRLPVVMAVVNRSLSSPLNIWCDWSDTFAERDSGWIQLYCESSQEAFDTIIQAYKIAENEKVSLPVMVCIDGFILSHVYEPVNIADKKLVRKFLPKYSGRKMDFDKPVTQGAWAGPDHFQEFKQAQHEAMRNSKDVIREANSEFKKIFGRGYGNGLVETYNMESAEHAIITMGSLCGTVKHILREKRIKDIGLIKVKSFRPFPIGLVKNSIKDLKSIGVLEKDISLGLGGALCYEIRGLTRKQAVSSFVGGLGGRDVKIEDFMRMFDDIREERRGLVWV